MHLHYEVAIVTLKLIIWQIVYVLDVIASAGLGVEQHLELGKRFLAQGQLNDALHHYDEAISKLFTWKSIE